MTRASKYIWILAALIAAPWLAADFSLLRDAAEIFYCGVEG